MRPKVSRLVSKARQLSGQEWRDLARAQLALLWAQGLVWLRPRGHLIQAVLDNTPRDVAAPHVDAAADIETASRLSLAVRRAAAYGLLRPRCLVRAVALQRLLERSGVKDSRVRIGVRMTGTRFDAHAWAEVGGIALGEDEGELDSLEVLATARVAGSPR
jgi:hypothetical protein